MWLVWLVFAGCWIVARMLLTQGKIVDACFRNIGWNKKVLVAVYCNTLRRNHQVQANRSQI